MTHHKWSWVAAALAVAAPAAGCSSSHHGAAPASSSTTLTTTAVTSSTTAAGSSTTTPGGSSTTTTAAPATTASSAAATSSVPAGPSRCASSSLTGSLTDENGTAGSVYYTLRLANHGASTCILQGWPGVSFVTGSGGRQVGASAARIPGPAPSVSLAPGSSAGAVLQITEATNFGSGCGLTPTAGLRIYPPDQLAAIYVPHPDQACSNTVDVTLHVGTFRPAA